ncbi:coenzyme F420-0:L-glutamate ligase [Nocardioides sp. InS609-2]|uniref:coenzyme F420-0:L-glutamate ligase n=1 Tax=Nocardioides sp. InS609-2 TaxID=2760705 RepID=UPI0020C0E26A|nr:coenzyme F420-0:L-glutamate ligase [Nocardioides sp. InS609-2]
MTARLEVFAPDDLPEITAGDDLARLVADRADLHDGDVVAVTSKVVAKAEGRVRPGDRDDAVAGETARIVARRGPVLIVRTHHGLTMAAAGVDASNVATGTVVLLPVDPDASARALRERLLDLTGVNVGVVVTDTAGRAWREGQTDMAIGVAGLTPLEDFVGRFDGHGNELAVTMPAVADEIAGAAELVQGKLHGRPVAVLRGRADLVLPAGEHGPGAQALVRDDATDMFGYGAREAVVRALAGQPDDRAPFGTPATLDDLAAALAQLPGVSEVSEEGARARVAGADRTVGTAVAATCFAFGWQVDALDDTTSGIAVLVSPVTT